MVTVDNYGTVNKRKTQLLLKAKMFLDFRFARDKSFQKVLKNFVGALMASVTKYEAFFFQHQTLNF